MPEIIPDHVPSPRTLLAWDGTVYRPVSIDAAGRLQVRGEDQLFSFRGVLVSNTTGLVSGAGGYIDSPAVPADDVWVVTTITGTDYITAVTAIRFFSLHPIVEVGLLEDWRAFAIGQAASWGGHTYLYEDGVIRVHFNGALVGDTVGVGITGYIMTLET